MCMVSDDIPTYSGYDGLCLDYAIYMKMFPDKVETSYIVGDVRLDISIHSCIHSFIQETCIECLLCIKQYSIILRK